MWLTGSLYGSPSTTVYSTLDKAGSDIFPGTNQKKINIKLTNQEKEIIESKLMMEIPSQNITIYEYNKKMKHDEVGEQLLITLESITQLHFLLVSMHHLKSKGFE